MASTTLTLTEKNFDAQVQKGGILFIDFWADWCAPCKSFAPIYEGAAKKHGDIVFGKLDVDAQEGLADDFDIQGIPTLIAIRDGVVVAREEGALPAKVLEEVVSGVRALDMDFVRAELEAEEKKAAAPKKAKTKPAAKAVTPKAKRPAPKKKPVAKKPVKKAAKR